MKRNVNLIVLSIEILAIVVLHAVKINQAPVTLSEPNGTLSQIKVKAAPIHTYTLLSIK